MLIIETGHISSLQVAFIPVENYVIGEYGYLSFFFLISVYINNKALMDHFENKAGKQNKKP